MADDIAQLVKALERGTLALFLGADLPEAVTGLPDRATVARGLAARHGLAESDSLAAVAQQVGKHGQRFEIVSYLRDRLDSAGKGPQPFHRAVVDLVRQHEVATLVTTAYDDLLERAFEEKDVKLDVVVRGGDVMFANPRTPTLIKLYGDLDQVDTLVVTEDDHYGLWRDREKEALLHEVRSALGRNAVLFVGYNLADPDFNLLWREVLDRAGRFAIGAYAAWPGAGDAQKQVWEGRRVRVLDLGAIELLGRLLGKSVEVSVNRQRVRIVDEGDAEPGTMQFNRLHVDPNLLDSHPISGPLRQLLTKALPSTDAVRRFCKDDATFQAILPQFGSGHGLAEMVDRVITHCETFLLLDELLVAVAHANPRQYAQFVERLEAHPAVQVRGEPIVVPVAGPDARPREETPAASPIPPSVHAARARFEDLELLIGDAVDGRYPVHVLASPAGEGEGVFDPPFEEAELREALWRIEMGVTDETFLKDLGRRLFRALFDGNVRARYAQSVGATTPDGGLRIRLRIDPAELHQLPWELMYDPEPREFLVLSTHAHLTRYLHVPRPTSPLTVDPPLRLLIAVAAPKNLAHLNVDAEVAQIREALDSLCKDGIVTLEVEPHATRQSLRRRLIDGRPHVLHYIGHGGLEGDRGVLYLEDAHGVSDPLEGPVLGTLLRREGVRLALLNACLTAREASPEGVPAEDPTFPRRRAAFLGVGPALVDAGLGAVVAMQFSVSDASAVLFARDFYDQLARFRAVDECVAYAREAVDFEVGRSRADWAKPVLFMRAPDGVLFRERERA